MLPHSLNLGLHRRLPSILQAEATECGLACLAMVAAYHGRRVDLAALRRRFPVSLKGATLAALIGAAHSLGLATRPLKLELGHLPRLQRPCILHWRMSHFVVLASVSRRGVVIHDPAAGEREVTASEISEAFTGVALELWPAPDFLRRDERRRVRLRDLVGQVQGFSAALLQVLVLALVLEIFAVLSPLFLQWVIDHVLVAASRDLLTTLAVGFALLVLLEQAVSSLRAWSIMHFGTLLNVQWHANTFTHLLTLPVRYFEQRHVGDVISRFRSIDVIQRTLTTAFVEALMDGLMAVVVLAVLVLYSPALAAVCLAAMMLYVAARVLLYGPLRRATHEQIAHAAAQESHFLETVRGARSIKLFQRQHERRSSWLALLVEQVNAGLTIQKLHILFRLVNGLVSGLENVLVIWLGALLVLDGRFSVGMLTAFVAYKRLFTSRVGLLVDRVFELKMLHVQAERLADVVLEPPESDPAEALGAIDARRLPPTVQARALRFRYAEHEPYVLDGVDLAIAAGESVAIVGPSGCGKTTLVRVLLGILRPTQGEVLIGGVEVTRLGAHALRRMLGSVTQNDTLFAGSIADNICFFDERADLAWIEQCARLACIHEDIVQMPMSYGTLVGDMGSVLSGGQQQRVLLARALYKRPAILLLDEATSHLDLRREILVNAAIRSLRITRIVVAHRPQTAAASDRIVRLERGKIVSERRVPSAGAA